MTASKHSNEFIHLLYEPDHEGPKIIFVTVTIPEMFPVVVRYGQTNKYSYAVAQAAA